MQAFEFFFFLLVKAPVKFRNLECFQFFPKFCKYLSDTKLKKKFKIKKIKKVITQYVDPIDCARWTKINSWHMLLFLSKLKLLL